MTNQDICMACGKCCKECWWCEGNWDIARRFMALEGVKVTSEEREASGQKFWLVTIKHPCRWLKKMTGGKVYCSIQNIKPGICRAFPYNVPLSYFEALRDLCPIMDKTLKELGK